MPSDARSQSKRQLFDLKSFNITLKDPSRFHEYIFAYRCWEVIIAIEKGFAKDKNNKYGTANFGYGLVYGKYSIISACMLQYVGEQSFLTIGEIVDNVLKQWLKFESHVITKPANEVYFKKFIDESGVERLQLNFDNYYKGKTLIDDIKKFFKKVDQK